MNFLITGAAGFLGSALANQLAREARDGVSNFPDSEFKRALLWVPDFVVAREK